MKSGDGVIFKKAEKERVVWLIDKVKYPNKNIEILGKTEKGRWKQLNNSRYSKHEQQWISRLREIVEYGS